MPERTKLLRMGRNTVWWCPDCGEVKLRAQRRGEHGNRYLSPHCIPPLVRVDVVVSPITTMIEGTTDA